MKTASTNFIVVGDMEVQIISLRTEQETLRARGKGRWTNSSELAGISSLQWHQQETLREADLAAEAEICEVEAQVLASGQ